MDERSAYVTLALVPGIGSSRLGTVLRTFGGPIGALEAPFELLSHLPGFSRAAATALRCARVEQGERALERMAELGGHCLLPGDPSFPETLREIPDPPTVLFTLGNHSVLSAPAVAIVGSRDHSSYGAEVCRTLSAGAARAGLAIVSGMARGLDALAQSTALEVGGATIGVLGNGVGVIYPSANRALYERVALEGLLVTEFPPGERPHAGSFPRRNRMISGLARATVVVEAAVASGTLITVEAALSQGREVMAVPGAITSPTSAGTNRLIQEGAAPLLGLEDLLVHYPEARGGHPNLGQLRPAAMPSATNPEERPVMEALAAGTLHLDDLAAALGRPVAEVLGLLTGMELSGLVQQQPGRRFGVRG